MNLLRSLSRLSASCVSFSVTDTAEALYIYYIMLTGTSSFPQAHTPLKSLLIYSERSYTEFKNH